MTYKGGPRIKRVKLKHSLHTGRVWRIPSAIFISQKKRGIKCRLTCSPIFYETSHVDILRRFSVSSRADYGSNRDQLDKSMKFGTVTPATLLNNLRRVAQKSE